MAMDSEYWTNMRDGATAKAEELGIELSVTAPLKESDIQDQVTMIDAAINKRPDAIIIAPCDATAILPSLKRAKEYRVPIILVDSDLAAENQGLRVSFVGVSNIEAAKQAGAIADGMLNDGDKVLLISQNPNAIDHKDRIDGFQQAITKGVEFLPLQYAETDVRNKTYEIVSAAVISNPDIKFIWGTSGEIIAGAVSALDKAGVQVKVAGFDYTSEIAGFAEAGKVCITVDQSPYNIGANGVKVVQELINKTELPSFYQVQAQVTEVK
jgi:ribose transport system substrate-binding protein